jgi:DNA helicase-2/ATP-dependent DNA helicase PcrA
MILESPQPSLIRPMDAAWLDKLNPEQRLAATYAAGIDEERAPLLIIAGAGSGKTNTLAHRVAYLIVNGADPRRILLMTFSRRAAAEMSRRVERIVGSVPGFSAATAGAALTWAGTFHGIGARLLRDYAEQIGVSPSFTIHDREDSADLMNLVRHELGLSRTEKRFPTNRTCLQIYSRAVNAELPLEEVLGTAFPWCADWEDELRQLFARYVEAKQKNAVLDYDDLLLYWAHAAAEPSLGAHMGERFDHVLVDEYQDTNRLQSSILLALRPNGEGVTVVGDDAQSIYAFRAATVRNILDFPSSFATPARVVTLERNYRSTQKILAAATAVIELAEERFTKNLWSDRAADEKPRLVLVADDRGQSDFVVDKILENREAGVRLKSQAVLFRASHHSAALELELTRRNIPFVKFGGLKFLDAAHVKDVLACLRWAENPRDQVAGFRLLQLLPGFGPATAGQILDRMADASDPVRALEKFEPPRGGDVWRGFAEMIGRLHLRASGWPAELGLVRSWYEPHLARTYDDAHIRAADILQLEQIASGYSSRERFLTELTLDPPDAVSDEAGVPHLDEDYLILSTIHSAKGQEWASVFVLNCVDGCIPSDLGTGTSGEIEEERRLLYVAMTRARDQLSIMIPQRFYKSQQAGQGDRHLYAIRTRFIPDALLEKFELLSWPVVAEEARREVRGATAAVDIGARMRGMWR